MSDAKRAYREICRQRPELPIFFQDWYLDAVCDDGEWDVLISRYKDETAAVFPYFLKQKWGFRYFSMPHFVKHLGPFIFPEFRTPRPSIRILQDLIGRLPRIASFKQDFHPTLTNWLPFYWNGYEQTTRYTYLLDLAQSPQELFDNLNRNMRRNIRKAEKQVEIREDLTLETFYEINCKSFRRQGIAIPYSFEQLHRHDASLQKNRARKIFAAQDEQGRLHSAAYLIWDRTAAYYHLSGDDPTYRQSGSGIYLIWKAILHTREELGLPVFDFEGSMLEPVENIRRQFGARQQPYFRVWKYHSNSMFAVDWLRGKA